MTTPDMTPGQRQPTDPESNRASKRCKTTETDDESTLTDDCDIADITDLDDEGFRLVRHRKERTVGIPVIITPVTEGADLKKVNPIALSTEIEEILGASPVRSRFTAQGALLLDVQTEEHVNALLSCKSISGTAISARVPNSYLQNTCIIRGVPKWYTDEELLNYLKPQGVYHARRVTRRVQTSESEWESRRTNTVVLTFAPNTDRPEKINLGFTRHETIDYVETPPRCFKCQRYGHVAKYCRGDQRCKRCGGPHDFKTCTCRENFLCANCSGGHPASYSKCPTRAAAIKRKKTFILGPTAKDEKNKTKKKTESRRESDGIKWSKTDFPSLQPPSGTQATVVPSSSGPAKTVKSVNRDPIEEKTDEQPDKRSYVSALQRPQSRCDEKTPQEDCQQVLRALFKALRSHIEKMPASSMKDMLEVVLALESVILSSASS